MKRLFVLLLIMSASAAYGEIYTWKDARGTVHYTNSIDEIPGRYLKKARVYDVATGKKGALATAHPAAAPSAPAGTAGPLPAQPAPAPMATPVPMPASPPPAVTQVPPAPPAAEATSPRLSPRESRSQRRERRSRRDYSEEE